ncbi:hypothetical protein OnM2_086063 [Erysiphe neolycopersici]|uniref:Uncharacterized protein n=1 Tax=Erysiphe neolycopersici TaxID=212602 RepID=A0A420HEH5_9PEZI|nr:hypothetical protein OnM2_086063 [Erysiphe neolycopersici]
MESFSETRMEIDFFSDSVSPCPETNVSTKFFIPRANESLSILRTDI